MPDDGELDALMWSHRRMAWFAVMAIGLGIAVGVTVFQPEWALAKRALGGAFLGAGSAIMLLANRLLRDAED